MKFFQPVILVIFLKNTVAHSPGYPAVSPEGRLLETFERSSLERLDHVTRRLVEQAASEDAANTQTLFDLTRGWPSVINLPQGPMLTLDMSSRTDDPLRVTFLTREQPEVMVRFVHDCEFQDSSAHKMVPHPALTEIAFSSRARRAGVGATSYHYVSPPVPFPSGQMFAGLSSSQVEQCRSVNGAVRLIIFRKIRGESLRDILTRCGRVDPVFALKVGKSLMQAVKGLHQSLIFSHCATIGITHGNLLLEDVFVEHAKDASGEVSVKLGGFLSSRVSWMDKQTGRSLKPQLPFSSLEFLKTPWELIHGPLHQYTVQDDVYRAVQLISILLNGLGLEQGLLSKALDGSLAQYKLRNPVILLAQFDEDPFRTLPLSTEGKSAWISSLSTVNARTFGFDANSYDDISQAFDSMIQRAQIELDAARTGSTRNLGGSQLVPRSAFSCAAGRAQDTRSQERVGSSSSPDPSFNGLNALAFIASRSYQGGRSGPLSRANYLAMATSSGSRNVRGGIHKPTPAAQSPSTKKQKETARAGSPIRLNDTDDETDSDDPKRS
jgi:hypothetical protein